MMLFGIGIEPPHLVTTQCLQGGNARQKHPGHAALGCIGQHFRCRRDRRRIAFGFWDGPGEIGYRLTQCVELLAVRYVDRLIELALPAFVSHPCPSSRSDSRWSPDPEGWPWQC